MPGTLSVYKSRLDFDGTTIALQKAVTTTGNINPLFAAVLTRHYGKSDSAMLFGSMATPSVAANTLYSLRTTKTNEKGA
jgi:hypothetical protein